MIPGTDTSIRVGGFVDETIDYYLQNGPANGNAEHDGRKHRQSATQCRSIPVGKQIPGYPSPGNLVPASNNYSSRGNGVFLKARGNRA